MNSDKLLNWLNRLEVKIDKILELQSISITFNTQKDVANYLGVNPKTIYNYIKNGRLKEGVHYYKIDGQTKFHTDEIIQFKKNQADSKKLKSIERITVNEKQHSVVKSLLKGL